MTPRNGYLLKVHSNALLSVLAHARQSAPNECVGVLQGRGQVVARVRPLQTVRATPNSFVADPLDYAEVEEESEQHGVAVIGYYHSHPIGPATPSLRDRICSARGGWTGLSPRWELIVSLRNPLEPIVRAFFARDGDWKAGNISIVESPERRQHSVRTDPVTVPVLQWGTP